MLRILVADDSAVVRVTLARRLRASGVEVVEASSAAAALEVDTATFDAAVLDVDLGDGWGDEVAARLRAHNAALPIAFFTSSTDRADLRAPFGPTFAKPSDADGVTAWALRLRSGG